MFKAMGVSHDWWNQQGHAKIAMWTIALHYPLNATLFCLQGNRESMVTHMAVL